jgi:hypothetical protein
MRQRFIALALTISLALLAVATSPVAALASNVIYPATYTGTATTGGTVEFDVSSDGTQITKFVLNKVPVPPCGTITGETPRKVEIVDDSFTNSMGLLHFSGTFPAVGQAQGSLSYHRKDGSCDSQEVTWIASAPLPPPPVTLPPPTAPPPVSSPLANEPPGTRITHGPSGTVHTRQATMRFNATEPESTFKCRLDGSRWRSCESAQFYGGLGDGGHRFEVKAIDSTGIADPTPAKRRWRVASKQAP